MSERVRLDVGLALAYFEWNYYGRGAEVRRRVSIAEEASGRLEAMLAEARANLAAAQEAEREESRRFAFRIGAAIGRRALPPGAYVTSVDDSDGAELVIPTPLAPT